jgi:predicted metallopeptidase
MRLWTFLLHLIVWLITWQVIPKPFHEDMKKMIHNLLHSPSTYSSSIHLVVEMLSL